MAVARLKKIRTTKADKQSQFNTSLRNITSKTKNQHKLFEAFDDDYNIVAVGSAGTGKSFILLYLALDDIMNNPDTNYNKVIIIRSCVPTRDIGFLPGTPKEKREEYETPYVHICNELFGRDDAFSILKQKNIVEFTSTSFLRGLTFENCIILFDEIQSATFHEIDTVVTRIGNNCQLLMCGDSNQNDLKKEESGFRKFMKIASEMEEFKVVTFTSNDIVRSGFVKNYIIQKEKVEQQ